VGGPPKYISIRGSTKSVGEVDLPPGPIFDEGVFGVIDFDLGETRTSRNTRKKPAAA
jgi:hypothetical protein